MKMVITYNCPDCNTENEQDFDFSEDDEIHFNCSKCGFENSLTKIVEDKELQ